MSSPRLKLMKKIAQTVINRLKSDPNTLAILITGSLVNNSTWENSDIDLIRIVKEKTKPQRWKHIQGIRVEITDLLKEDFKTNCDEHFFYEDKLSNQENLRFVYNPHEIEIPKLKYTTEYKLHALLLGLGYAQIYKEKSKKCFALKKYFSYHKNLRDFILILSSSIFAFNEIVRNRDLHSHTYYSIDTWLEDYKNLPNKPKQLSEAYEKILGLDSNKEYILNIHEKLQELFDETWHFCHKSVLKCIKEIRKTKQLKDIKFLEIEKTILKKMIEKSNEI